MWAAIQDDGRCGYQHIGITPGGAADKQAFQWANVLCGNALTSPVIEVVMGNIALVADNDICVAITGAEVDVLIGGRRVNMWEEVRVPAGQPLRLGQPSAGLRNYISLAGEWEIPVKFDSVSTTQRERIGGLNTDGQSLLVGDRIPIKARQKHRVRRSPKSIINKYRNLRDDIQPLRFIPAYQFERFDLARQQLFLSSTYTVSQHTDRMGCRLSGNAINWAHEGMLSEGLSAGAVQIPPDGQPIVMLCEHQTIGGYPKIGTLTQSSVNWLSQLGPGTQVRFSLCHVLDAHNQMHREQFMLERFIHET